MKKLIFIILLITTVCIFFSCSGHSDQKPKVAETWLVMVIDFFTSGYLEEKSNNYRYHTSKAFDSDPSTVWAEGEAYYNTGVGEYIGLEFETPVIIDEVRIMPGYYISLSRSDLSLLPALCNHGDVAAAVPPYAIATNTPFP